MDRTRAAKDARRAGVADAGTRTPRPGVRTDDVLDAIRNVPDEPQLPPTKVTGGQPRVTDLGTIERPLTQADLKREILKSLKSRRVNYYLLLKHQLVVQVLDLLRQVVLHHNVLLILLLLVAQHHRCSSNCSRNDQLHLDSMQIARLAGRGAQVAAAGMDYYTGSQDAKSRGAGTTRQVLRGLSRSAGGVVGGTLGAAGGLALGTAGGAFTGPGAVVTGTAGAFTEVLLDLNWK